MKKNVKINNNVEEIMENSEIKVEQIVKKERRSFKQIIIEKINIHYKNLPDDVIVPALDDIAAALDNIELILENTKKEMKMKKALNRKLGRYSKEEIEDYLKSLN